MKAKLLKTLSLILSLNMIFTNSMPAFAHETDAQGNSIEDVKYQNSEDTEFENSTNVYAEIASQYKVTIPKTVVLSGISKAAKYFVKVEGDIAGTESVTVTPDDKVNLYTTGKDMQTGSIKQDKTIWQLDNFTTDANGSVYVPGLTAGKWTGAFNFNLNLTSEKIAGDIIIPEDQWSDEEINITFKLGESKLVKTFENVSLISSDNNIISVEDNKLNALKVGKSKITVSKNDDTLNKQIINATVIKGKNDEHTHTNSSITEENKIEPTCVKSGSVDEVIYCTTCNEELNRNTKTIPALGHKFNEGIITKDSTCTEDGTKTYTCTICSDTKEETIPATGHTAGEFKTVKESTCAEKGLKEQRCTVCDELLDAEEIALKEHTPKAAVIENKVKATCTENGSYDEVIYCDVCNTELSRQTKTVPATGHSFGQYEDIDGVQTRICTVCDEKEENGYTAYNITYNLNGGNATNPTSYNKNTETFTLNNPTKNYYTFTGWTGSNGSNAQTNVSINKDSTGNKVFTANYKPIDYTINYTLNGGSISGQKTSYNIETASFSLPTPTKTGYTFAGWTGSNGSTAQTSVSITKGSTGNKSYTANWKINTYSISYNLNGGNISGQKTSYDVTTASFTLPTPVRENYVFAGWSGTGISNLSKTVTVSKGSTGNRSYSANWTSGSSLRKYSESDTTVSYTYNSNDGTYTITQQGGSSGWGVGVLGDNSGIIIPWGKEYCYTFECYVPVQAAIRLDHNANPCTGTVSGGNDSYSNNYVVIDGVKNGSTTLSANTWHTIEIRFTNGNAAYNPSHVLLTSYSTFGFDLTNASTFTYKVRNMSSRIVE